MIRCDTRSPALMALVWAAAASTATAACSGSEEQAFTQSGAGAANAGGAFAGAATSSAATSTATTSSATTGIGGGSSSCLWDGPTALWNKRIGGEWDQSAEHVASDLQGNVILAGSTCGDIDLGGGLEGVDVPCPDGEVIFVAKYSPAGDYLWSRVLADGMTIEWPVQWPSSLEVASDGTIFIAGAFTHWIDFGDGPRFAAGETDAFVTKFAPDGTLLWSRVYGSAGGDGAAVALDGTGHVLVSVVSEGKIDLGGGLLASAGGDDIFLVKLDTSGNHIWSKRFGSAGDQRLLSFAASGAGIGLFGIFIGTLDLGGSPLTTTPWASFAAKLDLDGNLVWARQYPSASDLSIYIDPYWMESTNKVKVDPSGNLWLDADIDFSGGSPAPGAACPCLAKLDANGNHLWSRRFASFYDGFQRVGIRTDDIGSVLLTGQFRSVIDFGAGPLAAHGPHDVFIAKLDPQGQPIWSHRAGDNADTADYEIGRDIATDPAGNVLLAGGLFRSICFGLDTLAGEHDFDAFLVKLPPP